MTANALKAKLESFSSTTTAQMAAALGYLGTTEIGTGCQAFSAMNGALDVWLAAEHSGDRNVDIGIQYQASWNGVAAALGCSPLPFPSSGSSGGNLAPSAVATVASFFSTASTDPEIPPENDDDPTTPPPNEEEPDKPPPDEKEGLTVSEALAILRAIGVCSLSTWCTKVGGNEALAGARTAQGAGVCIAPIQSGLRSKLLEIWDRSEPAPRWAYNDEGDWRIPLKWCPDVPVAVDEASMLCDGTEVPPKTKPPTTNGGGGGGGGTAVLPLNLTPVAPEIRQVRHCPRGMVLAIDQMCYWKKLLPAALRLNRSKKAPVSYSDAKSIRKGFQASKRIKAYEKKIEKMSRKFVPPKRRSTPRRRLPPSC